MSITDKLQNLDPTECKKLGFRTKRALIALYSSDVHFLKDLNSYIDWYENELGPIKSKKMNEIKDTHRDKITKCNDEDSEKAEEASRKKRDMKALIDTMNTTSISDKPLDDEGVIKQCLDRIDLSILSYDADLREKILYLTNTMRSILSFK